LIELYLLNRLSKHLVVEIKPALFTAPDCSRPKMLPAPRISLMGLGKAEARGIRSLNHPPRACLPACAFA